MGGFGVIVNEEGLSKGTWLPEEDRVLMEYVECYGAKNWGNLVTRGLLRRSGKSCRLRWVNQLKPGLQRYGGKGCKRFTEQESNIVLALQLNDAHNMPPSFSCFSLHTPSPPSPLPLLPSPTPTRRHRGGRTPRDAQRIAGQQVGADREAPAGAERHTRPDLFLLSLLTPAPPSHSASSPAFPHQETLLLVAETLGNKWAQIARHLPGRRDTHGQSCSSFLFTRAPPSHSAFSPCLRCPHQETLGNNPLPTIQEGPDALHTRDGLDVVVQMHGDVGQVQGGVASDAALERGVATAARAAAAGDAVALWLEVGAVRRLVVVRVVLPVGVVGGLRVLGGL
ncbi:unnamed protein product [Closterium sp. NIES-65]|nr:unnamed protein product [Closterium sp. NIES-65]